MTGERNGCLEDVATEAIDEVKITEAGNRELMVENVQSSAQIVRYQSCPGPGS